MGGPFLPVIDSRPNRETQHFSTFRRQNFWRIFLRTNGASQGGVNGKGFVSPTFIADLLAGSVQSEYIGDQVYTLTTQTTPNTALQPASIYYLPVNAVALTIPIQSIMVSVAIATNNNFNTNVIAVIDNVTVELIKVNSSGTITQLATATTAYGSGNNTTNYVVSTVLVNLSIGSLISISATERLAFRITYAGHSGGSSPGSGTCFYVINGAGGVTVANMEVY